MQPAAVELDQCAAGRLKTDAKTKVKMGAGIFGRTNAAAGVFLNIYNKRVLHRRC